MKNLWPRWVALALGCLLGGCSVENNPEMPTWEAEFNVPLGVETTTLQEWIDESDDLCESATGLVAFHFEGTLERTEIGDRLALDPVEASFHSAIGAFTLRSPASQSGQVSFSDLWPPSSQLEGQTVPVPGFQFDGVETPLPEFDEFHSMTLEEGRLTVVLANRLPVDVEDVTATLVEDETWTEILSVPIPRVGTGQADSAAIDLAGVTLTSGLLVRVSGGSPGSGGEAVYVDVSCGLEVEVGLSDLRASRATAELPATDVTLDETVDIPDGTILVEAEVAAGALDLNIENDLPVRLTGLLTVAEFADPSGEPLTLGIDLPPAGDASAHVELAGYTLRPAPPIPEAAQRVNVSASMTTEETGEPVTLTAEDGVSVDLSIDTLTFARVRGILDSTSFEVEPSTAEVEFPEDLSSVSLQEARLTLTLVSTVPVPTALSLEAVGESGDGKVTVLAIPLELAGSQDSPPETTAVVLDQDNSAIVDMLNSLPRSVEVSGQGWVGDGETEGEVSREDYIEGAYRVEVPLHLAIEEQTIDSDLTEIEILPEEGNVDGGDGAVDGELTRRMRSAELWVAFHNHTPFGLVATASFATDSARVFTDPDVSLESVQIAAGAVDETGEVTAATSIENHLTLTEDDLDLFRNPSDEIRLVYMGTRLRLLSTEGQAVKVRGSDYIQTAARIRVAATVDRPDDD